MPDFLERSLLLGVGLQAIHDCGLVLANLNPGMILCSRKGSEIRYFDLSRAELIGDESKSSRPGLTTPGAGLFAAPELFGRLPDKVDQRSDLYSFGLICYLMLCGRLPLAEENARTAYFQTVTRSFPKPGDLNPAVPRAISDLTMKLLAKNPAARYQSIAKVISELLVFQSDNHKPENLAAGKVPGNAPETEKPIPELFFGREKELDLLRVELTRICSDEYRSCLISGAPGVGKTQMIEEFQTLARGKKVLFCRGKFDQLDRSFISGGLTQAIKELIGTLLMQGDESLQRLRKKFQPALAHYAGLPNRLIPELNFFSDIPPSTDLSGPESRKMLHLSLREIVSLAAGHDQPLVLFLDDLQWIDGESLDLLKRICSDPPPAKLLLISAFRDQDQGESPYLAEALNTLRNSCPQPGLIELKEFSMLELSGFLELLLGLNRLNSRQLAELVFAKCRGNPYHLKEFLLKLQRISLLFFCSGQWSWDSEGIAGLAVSANLGQLLANRIESLPEKQFDLLGKLACLGSVFPSLAGLVLAGEENLDGFKALQNQGFLIAKGNICAFAHDRIQETVYNRRPPEELPALHLEVGRLLLAAREQGQLPPESSRIICEQLNRGEQLLANPTDRRELAELNLQTGMELAGVFAYEDALVFLEKAERLLPETKWDTDYKLSFAVYRELVEICFYCGRLQQSSDISEQLLAACRNPLERAEILVKKTNSILTAGRSEEAIRAALAGLVEMGLELPPQPGLAVLLLNLYRVNKLLTRPGKADISRLPHDLSEAGRLTTRLLNFLATAAFNSGKQRLFALAISKLAAHSLEHGNQVYAPFSYIHLAIILGHFPFMRPKSLQLADQALALTEQFSDSWGRMTALFHYAMFIQPWREHWKGLRKNFQAAYDLALSSGRLMDFMWGRVYIYLWDPALDIPEWLAEGETSLGLFTASGNHLAKDRAEATRRLALCLAGKTSAPGSLEDDDFRVNDCLQRCRENNFLLTELELILAQIQAALFFGDYQQAGRLLDESEKDFNLIKGSAMQFELVFYSFLVMTQGWPQWRGRARKAARRRIRRILAQVGRWAKNCPENFSPFLKLMQAEKARLRGQTIKASRCYESALAAFHQYQSIRYEALSAELYGKFLLGLGLPTAAAPCLRQACQLYRAWGATAKVEQLQADYGKIPGVLPVRSTDLNKPSPPEQNWGLGGIATMDADSVVAAGLAVAAESDPEKLFATFMKIIIENSGAGRGILVMEDKLGPLVSIKAESGETLKIEPAHSSLDTLPEVPQSVLRYVLRTGKSIPENLGDSLEKLSIYRELGPNRPKSLLCVPLAYQGRKLGALYLENDQTEGVFNPQSTRVLAILLAQFVVSLENNRLFQEKLHLLEEARQTEENLHQVNKMVSLGTMASGIAHEINNPSNLIMLNNAALAEIWSGLAPLLEKANQLDQHLRIRNLDLPEVLNRVPRLFAGNREATERIRDLSHELRTFTRSEAFDLQNRVNLNQVAESAVSLAGHLISQATGNFRVELQADLPPIRANFRKLEQVAVNLLQNACQALAEKTKGITLSTRFNQAENELELIVSDQGTGILETDLPRIMDPFFSTRRSTGGVGLGLSISAAIVKKHGGRLEFSSTPGLGTKATVFLPVSEPDQPAEKRNQVSP